MKLIAMVLELLFPPKCLLCGRVLKAGELDLCKNCRVEAPWYDSGKRSAPFLDSITAVWYYKENVRKCLLRLKFYRFRHLAPGLGRLLAARVRKDLPQDPDMITWVPVSFLRKLGRGFDQSELIARAVGRELGIPVQPVLRKHRHNPRQSGLRGGEKRRANVLGAYRVLSPEQVRGKQVLLIDDILTTGATAGECAKLLRLAGAAQVHSAVIAAAGK